MMLSYGLEGGAATAACYYWQVNLHVRLFVFFLFFFFALTMQILSFRVCALCPLLNRGVYRRQTDRQNRRTHRHARKGERK
ncbi:Uncharacterized protein APZ42_027403 [Daphnia magna]|uniref:Uncharacterized protein n=1 Tax=Daphnia magna TaxID=35525 RepID=A0A164RIT7_9CRUS|nr:Uncharacterized protein APZ42_027403 [Daphnia magna]